MWLTLLLPNFVNEVCIPKQPQRSERTDCREEAYGQGQSDLRDDYSGSKYKYHVYGGEAPYIVEGSVEQRSDRAAYSES
jgi:hypothetical protein